MLRSAEVKLLFNRFVQLRLDLFSFFYIIKTSGGVKFVRLAALGLSIVSLAFCSFSFVLLFRYLLA